ncbi:uncharacterized protein LOC119662248 [Teleopsis dalmanni]|uniref:uncharacterized protein LOC119662248 n=1 Tax=Teleopsis dalmanni TaxID=139649 RepID=UPI0018CEF97E|nr:uncharacterized protein LOC119662248 [Teleopsis dalmanni]
MTENLRDSLLSSIFESPTYTMEDVYETFEASAPAMPMTNSFDASSSHLLSRTDNYISASMSGLQMSADFISSESFIVDQCRSPTNELQTDDMLDPSGFMTAENNDAALLHMHANNNYDDLLSNLIIMDNSDSSSFFVLPDDAFNASPSDVAVSNKFLNNFDVSASEKMMVDNCNIPTSLIDDSIDASPPSLQMPANANCPSTNLINSGTDKSDNSTVDSQKVNNSNLQRVDTSNLQKNYDVNSLVVTESALQKDTNLDDINTHSIDDESKASTPGSNSNCKSNRSPLQSGSSDTESDDDTSSTSSIDTIRPTVATPSNNGLYMANINNAFQSDVKKNNTCDLSTPDLRNDNNCSAFNTCAPDSLTSDLMKIKEINAKICNNIDGLKKKNSLNLNDLELGFSSTTSGLQKASDSPKTNKFEEDCPPEESIFDKKLSQLFDISTSLDGLHVNLNDIFKSSTLYKDILDPSKYMGSTSAPQKSNNFNINTDIASAAPIVNNLNLSANGVPSSDSLEHPKNKIIKNIIHAHKVNPKDLPTISLNRRNIIPNCKLCMLTRVLPQRGCTKNFKMFTNYCGGSRHYRRTSFVFIPENEIPFTGPIIHVCVKKVPKTMFMDMSFYIPKHLSRVGLKGIMTYENAIISISVPSHMPPYRPCSIPCSNKDVSITITLANSPTISTEIRLGRKFKRKKNKYISEEDVFAEILQNVLEEEEESICIMPKINIIPCRPESYKNKRKFHKPKVENNKTISDEKSANNLENGNETITIDEENLVSNSSTLKKNISKTVKNQTDNIAKPISTNEDNIKIHENNKFYYDSDADETNDFIEVPPADPKSRPENDLLCKRCDITFRTPLKKKKHDCNSFYLRYCRTCKKSYPSVAFLKLHLENQHNDAKHNCTRCSRKYLCAAKLDVHLYSHSVVDKIIKNNPNWRTIINNAGIDKIVLDSTRERKQLRIRIKEAENKRNQVKGDVVNDINAKPEKKNTKVPALDCKKKRIISENVSNGISHKKDSKPNNHKKIRGNSYFEAIDDEISTDDSFEEYL